MTSAKKTFVVSVLSVCSLLTCELGAVEPDTSPQIDPALIQRGWSSQWISHPTAPAREYGVFHFRQKFTVAQKPERFIIHISADNRYRLFVNGQFVCDGPARGDLAHWRYETVDIAAQMRDGENTLAALVWNYGEAHPVNQASHQTAFIIQGDGVAESVANTGKGWKVLQNQAYRPIGEVATTVGPFDRVEGAKYPWGWQEPGFDDSQWTQARNVGQGTPFGTGSGADWALVPRTIPAMESRMERITSIRRSSGLAPEAGFLAGTAPLVVAAHSEAVLLLDQAHLTTAYPQLSASGGQGSEIQLTYAEALYDDKNEKGNRNDIDGRHIEGNRDLFLPDGGTNRLFNTLWFRTYRYIEMRIKTADAPLTIHDFYGQYTGYPFESKATFSSSDPTLEKIWETGWRTARLCAGETYYDCPYYEQLQYVGDTRIQSLISLYVTGDDRLMRNAICHFDDSRIPEGLTQSRYPSSVPQIIPPFSIFWVGMIHDYWMHREDHAFVSSFLDAVRGVMVYHEKHLDESGMLGPVPWWSFVDWPDQWPWDNAKSVGGVPSGSEEGKSAILTLQYVYGLQMAADLARAFHRESEAVHYRSVAAKLIRVTRLQCWDESRKLLADTPAKDVFSQHANLLAVLTGLVPKTEVRALMEKVVADPQLIQCTFYYRFYLYKAMKKAGLGESYVQMLEPWQQMIKLGLTTFAERPEQTRSDCHAWSASPNYDLLASVCGIEPGSPGFKTVRIEPHLGTLTWVKGSMPHPMGQIEVDLKRSGQDGIQGEVVLPEGLTGNFVWNGKKFPLTTGKQAIELP